MHITCTLVSSIVLLKYHSAERMLYTEIDTSGNVQPVYQTLNDVQLVGYRLSLQSVYLCYGNLFTVHQNVNSTCFEDGLSK